MDGGWTHNAGHYFDVLPTLMFIQMKLEFEKEEYNHGAILV